MPSQLAASKSNLNIVGKLDEAFIQIFGDLIQQEVRLWVAKVSRLSLVRGCSLRVRVAGKKREVQHWKTAGHVLGDDSDTKTECR